MKANQTRWLFCSLLALFAGSGALFAAESTPATRQVLRRVLATGGESTTAAEKAAATYKCSGMVVDTSGKPISGAVVELYQYRTSGPSPRQGMEMKSRTTSGTNGNFEVQLTGGVANILFAHKPGLAPAWSQYWSPRKEVTDERLQLVPPASVAGIVVDENDKPVADAEVLVIRAYSEKRREDGGTIAAYLPQMPPQSALSARTSTDGRFRIEGFPTNAAADLTVKKPGKVFTPPTRDYVSPETMQCRAGETEVKLVVGPAAAIEGEVVAADTGQPLAGVELAVRAPRAEFGPIDPIISGPDGGFRIPDVAPGDYQIWTSTGTNTASEWVSDFVSVKVEEGKTTKDVKVAAVRGGLLEVSVIGKEDGKPVAEANVSAFKREFQAGTVSGPNGLATLRVPPGEYQISAYREDIRSAVVKAQVESGVTNRVEIELNPPPRINGIVRDASGSPIAKLPVILFGGYSSPNAGEVVTDTDGKFSLKWNPQIGGRDRSFCVIARDMAHNLAASQDVDEQTTEVELKLEPGLAVSGRVEDPNGKPITNATVQLHLWTGNMGMQFGEKALSVDAEGRFQASALPNGRRFTLWANARGYGSGNRNVEPEAETNRVEVESFVLKVADQKLAGQVVDADDKPVARANVHMYGEGQPSASVRTDEKGQFFFDQVCEGQVRLSASAQQLYGNTQTQAGETNVVVKLGERMVYSRSERPQRASLKGKPLPDLSATGIDAQAIPEGKPVLLCLMDVEQRPCRRSVKTLAEQYETLSQKGLAVLGIQIAVTTEEAFKEWKEASQVPFPVGRVAESTEKTKWTSGLDSLPYMVLTDKDHKVTAEGFSLDDLEEKLKSVTP